MLEVSVVPTIWNQRIGLVGSCKLVVEVQSIPPTKHIVLFCGGNAIEHQRRSSNCRGIYSPRANRNLHAYAIWRPGFLSGHSLGKSCAQSLIGELGFQSVLEIIKGIEMPRIVRNRRYGRATAQRRIQQHESINSIRIGIEQMETGQGQLLADALKDIRKELKLRV